jgi:serine/threonine-protein kinase
MPTPEQSPPRQPGDVVAGKYRVEGVIGFGGMGVVLAARHEVLEQRVAIKFLAGHLASDPEGCARFMREARLAARLQSDHVARVFDVAVAPDGLPYMVMELLDGVDLDRELATRGALPIAEAVGYVLEALDALAEAHDLGIVHRDLKPANLFLATRPDGSRRVKVLDFGISKALRQGGEDASRTTTAVTMGSPGYMSPEHIRSARSVDLRTDLWSMGVILYELLTCKPAFDGESVGDTFAAIREDALPRVRDHRPEVPEALAAIVDRCLERDRERRWPDARTLAEALAPFAGEARPRRATAAIAVTHAGEAAATLLARSTPARTEATWSAVRAGTRAPRRALVIACAVAATVAVAVWWWRPASAPLPSAASDLPELLPSAPGAAAEPPPVVAPSTDTAPAAATASASASASAGARPPRRPPPASRPPRNPDDLMKTRD